MATDPKLLYQVSPIILTGGITTQISGSALPFAALLAALTSVTGINLAGSVLPFDLAKLDDAFGAFSILPGGSLVTQAIAKYPFANQFTAGNAIVREPLTLSVIMDAPMRGQNAFANKIAIMSALKKTLDTHNNLGGTYTVYTPAYMYTNLVMTGLSDASRATTTLPQNAWKFDFERPLVALDELQWAYSLNLAMLKLTMGVQTSGAVTGAQPGSPGAQPQLSSLITSGIGALLTATGLGPGSATQSPANPPSGSQSVIQ